MMLHCRRSRSGDAPNRKETDMAVPDRESLATGLVRIGENAVAKSNDALLDDYFTDDYKLHSPAGDFSRDEIKAYFAALRERLAPSADPDKLATATMASIQGGLVLTQARRDFGQLAIALDAAYAYLRAHATSERRLKS